MALPTRTPYVAAAALGGAVVGAVVCLVLLAPGTLVDVPWMTFSGSRWRLEVEAAGATLAAGAAAIFVVVILYSATYLPEHLAHAEGSARRDRQAWFVLLMTAFMSSMVLLGLATDLLVIFVALEITALLSFLLIAYDRGEDARRASVTALVVTAGTSLPILAAVLLFAADAGGTTLEVLRDWAARGGRNPVAAGLLAVGLLAKSAQVPLHFWLPRAMVAPTPVSAYLHSAALVAAGGFVMMRAHFLLAVPFLQEGLTVVGWTSIALGSVTALRERHLKRILAYSTIAQYGYVTVLIASGGPKALPAAGLYLVVHAIAKSALFLTAGAVTIETGADRLDRLPSKLGRRCWVLAIAAAVAAATLAGLPLTLGYGKDEVFFAVASDRGRLASIGAVLAAASTLAYSLRFYFGVFFRGGDSDSTDPVRFHRGLTIPVAALAVPMVVGGVWLAPSEALARAIGRSLDGGPVDVEVAYHLALTETTAMALAAYVAGVVIFAFVRGRDGRERSLGLSMAALADLGASIGARGSDILHRLEARDLHDRVAAVIVPSSLLVIAALVIGRPSWIGSGALAPADAPLVIGLVVTALAGIAAASIRSQFGIVILLSFAGYGLSLSMALLGAPDVALVTAVIETVMTLLLLGTIAPFRRMAKDRARTFRRAHRRHSPLVAALGGLMVAAAVFVVLSVPAVPGVARRHLELAERAHAKDVVTAILADFRGLDTAVETTVLVVAIAGAVAARRGSRRRDPEEDAT